MLKTLLFTIFFGFNQTNMVAPAYPEVDCVTLWYTGVSYRFPQDAPYTENHLYGKIWWGEGEHKGYHIIQIGDGPRYNPGQCIFT